MNFTLGSSSLALRASVVRTPIPGKHGCHWRWHLLREVIKLGLLDELELHVAPVILGAGIDR